MLDSIERLRPMTPFERVMREVDEVMTQQRSLLAHLAQRMNVVPGAVLDVPNFSFPAQQKTASRK